MINVLAEKRSNNWPGEVVWTKSHTRARYLDMQTGTARLRLQITGLSWAVQLVTSLCTKGGCQRVSKREGERPRDETV